MFSRRRSGIAAEQSCCSISSSPRCFSMSLAEERCTVALTVPTQLVMMSQSSSWGRELPDLRFFISGGAPCSARSPQKCARRLRDARRIWIDRMRSELFCDFD